MRSDPRRRSGFALATALFAIVIIGALIAGVFVASTQEFRVGRNGVLQARAAAASEYGLRMATFTGSGTAQNWNRSWNTQANGWTDSIRYAMPNGVDSVLLRVIRLSQGQFLISSEGRVGRASGAQARQRTASVVSLLTPILDMRGALTTRGATKIGGSSFINGTDTNQPGWNCPTLNGSTNLPGIATNDTNNIQTSGCNNYSCVAGSPKIAQDVTAGDTSTYFNYGNGIDWTDLMKSAQVAGKVVTSDPTGPSYNPDGSCKITDPGNWGDATRNTPKRACEDYFPILYSAGDLHLSGGGSGQGILLVNGSLKVTGGFEFYGPVIVRNDLDTQGTGGHFNGGVMAANVSLQQNTVLGNAVITYSSCVIAKIMGSVSDPMPMKARPWVQLP